MLLKHFYPIQYEEYVEKYSKEYGLDKFLVYAVILTESKFDEEAISQKGAIGLMQLMEKTAAECNDEAEFGYNIPDDLLNPEVNIRIGCYYLSKLKNSLTTDELMLSAYNAGIGNVNKWLDNNEYSDGKGGLKTIPITETEEYVDKVLKSYERYKEIY